MSAPTPIELVSVALHAFVGAIFDNKLGMRPFSNDELTSMSLSLAEELASLGLLKEPE